MIRKPILFLLLLVLSYSCGDDDQITDDTSEEINVTVEDLMVSINENPIQGQVLGTLEATTNMGSIQFSILAENPEGALEIDVDNGDLMVLDSTLYDFSKNPVITARAEAKNGEVSGEASIIINLIEEITVSIEDFEITIDENQELGKSLGTLVASTSSGELQFSILSQNPEGAIEVNSQTGELFVANSNLFEFDDNPLITAVVEARNEEVTAEGMITIVLEEVVETPDNVWSGSKITFERLPGVDEGLEENQDRITDNVWITRGSRAGLFNINQETAHGDDSPVDTEWARGSLEEYDQLPYTDWKTAVGDNPPDSVGRTYVVHLISDDIYLELKFLSWGISSSGAGSFSYERSTPSN